MRTIKKILFAIMSALPVVSIAHPGHGRGNTLSPDHYFGNPEHSIPIALVVGAVVAFSVWKWSKQRADK